MTNSLRWLWIALGLGTLFAIWLTPGWWNLGWGIIGVIFWIVIVKSYPNIWKDKYLKKMAIVWLILTLIMWTRNNVVVKVLSFLGWWWMAGTTIVLAKNENRLDGWWQVITTFLTGVAGFFGSFLEVILVLSQVKRVRGKWWKAIVGVLLAIPALYVFGSLFYAADPIFIMVVRSIHLEFKLDEKLIFDGIISIIFFASIFSLMRISLTKKIEIKVGRDMSVEVGVAGGLVVLLFVFFGLLQIPYLVISRGILEQQGIMLSDYTRRGYGEMLTACLMGFGVVSLIEALVKNKWQKRLSGVMLLAIVWIVVASTRRNYLYQANFGLTEARILGFFFSLGLLLTAIVYLKKIIKGWHTDWLIKQVGLIVGIILVVLNVTDVDWITASIKPPTLGYGIDYEYLANRSADGIEGWAKALDFAEKEIENKTYLSYEEFNPVSNLVWNLVGSRNSLEIQREKMWHFGGSWNMSSARAAKFWQQNNYRIDDLKNRSDEIMRQIDENQRRTSG